MAGVVHIPWYATVFRGDRFEVALEEIAPLALRYGATEYAIYRSRDDAYKFLQLATFEEQVRLRPLLERRGVLALARRLHRASTRCPCSTSGTTWWRVAGSARSRPSTLLRGAVVSPASFKSFR